MIALMPIDFAGAAPMDRYRVDYICERNHPTTDFSRKLVRHIDLRLSHDWSTAGLSDWAVTGPARLAGKASTFPAHTGSIGGSEGIRWRTASGVDYTALISISDIPSDLGPATLWLEVKRDGEKRVEKMTCGPISMHKLTKDDA